MRWVCRTEPITIFAVILAVILSETTSNRASAAMEGPIAIPVAMAAGIVALIAGYRSLGEQRPSAPGGRWRWRTVGVTLRHGGVCSAASERQRRDLQKFVAGVL
jgi:hypothetical protein